MVENLKAKENLNKKDEKSELIDLQKKTEWLCVNHLSLAIDESYKWIVKEYSYATIKSVQYLLNKLWYDCGKVDGILVTKWKNTSRTMEAVKRFQENNWLAVDGLPGPNTIKKLLEVNQKNNSNQNKEKKNRIEKINKIKKEDKVRYCIFYLELVVGVESYQEMMKENSYTIIKSVQYLLNKLWYDCGKVDGILVTKWKNTSKTMEAVKRFQENNWLAVDGLPGPNTIKKLLEVYQVKHYIKHKEENNKWTIEKKTIIEQEKYNRLTNKMGSLTNDELRRMVDFANSNPDKDGFISLDTDLTEIKEWQEEILSKVAGKIIFYRLEKLDNPGVVRAFVNWNVTDLWLKSLTSITDEVAIELAKIKSLHINKDILTLEQKEILKDKL